MHLSQPGHAFLKCAFASPDFNTDPGQGIPDKYEGKVLTRKDVLTQSTSFAAGNDTFILVAPVPGVAYFSASVPAGTYPVATTSFKATMFPGYTSLFGTTAGARSTNVSAFRYASMNAGIYPTSNQMQFAGSITVWKAPINLSTIQYPLTTTPATSQLIHALQGLESVQAVGPDNFSESFIKGVYTQSSCNEPEFTFSNIIEGTQTLPPLNVTIAQSGQPFELDAGAETAGGIAGWGNMDTIIIRVSAPTGAVNAAIVKVWACLEYRPNPSSALYQYAHDSPPLDAIAMAEYRAIVKELPLAVVAAENATMWERVKHLIKAGLGIASAIPGPVGMAAQGISGIASGVASLFI